MVEKKATRKTTTRKATPKGPACPRCTLHKVRKMKEAEWEGLLEQLVAYGLVGIQGLNFESHQPLICDNCGWFHTEGALIANYTSGAYRFAARMIGVDY